MQDINYKELLEKYMNHVFQCEGTLFIYAMKIPTFTQEEIEELKRISDSI